MTKFPKIAGLSAILPVILLVLSSHAQTVPIPADSTGVTEKEKIEIRRFTKEFLAQLHKTRDVRPLARKYLIKDFDRFFYDFLLDNEGSSVKKIEPLRNSERRRLSVDFMNWMSVCAPLGLIGEEDFAKQIPGSIAKDYKRLSSELDNEKWMATRSARLRFMNRMERLLRAMDMHFRKHPIEKTDSYLTQLRKREKIDDYNYSVSADVVEPDEDGRMGKWFRTHPDSPTYQVGTPIGLAVGIIRIKGNYKILLLMPWPISYDSRLGD